MRKIKRILTAFVFCLILSASTIPVCASAVSASNEETGYVYVLDDSADFLTDSQENSLQKQLYDLTAYCNLPPKILLQIILMMSLGRMPTVRSSSLTAA